MDKQERQEIDTMAARHGLSKEDRPMNITATQIAAWATTRAAQQQLPQLARKLLQAARADLTEIDMPAGDSITRHGWDGRVSAKTGNAWLPTGRSYWELSCEGANASAVTRKANKDYNNRLADVPPEERTSATYVAVTARKWTTKQRWRDDKAEDGWRAVRAYDADDLDQWLEATPAVALWFGELLGLQGSGVESVEHFWNRWAQQSDPVITKTAFFTDRERSRDSLSKLLREQAPAQNSGPVRVAADSIAVAAAFAAATILAEPELAAATIAITEREGWRYVEQNPNVRVVLAASPSVAERLPSAIAAYVTVIPQASSEPGARSDDEAAVAVGRPRRHVFEKALQSLGVDAADAERASRSTGRSWSVWRRRHARNPAVRRPEWLEADESWALSVVCLFGVWSEASASDRDAVSVVAGRPYEEVERALRALAALDDAPVFLIGDVWHAKSPLELLDLVSGQITVEESDRFFAFAQEVLSTPDPELDLPADDRPFAQLHGKVRPESRYLMGGLSKTLVRLAVFGPPVVVGRVELLVRELLLGADRVRWLSLASHLSSLAEASPTGFLAAVEKSLGRDDPPVVSLFAETTDSGTGFGRCWHADLLWAFELLAWSPSYVTRVALMLARLSDVPVRGNWSNSAFGSLFGVFRAWMPQTAVGVDERVALLDLLLEREPDVGFKLLLGLTNLGPATPTSAARPKARGFDTGAGYGATGQERWTMMTAAAERLVTAADGDAKRLAQLLSRMDSLVSDQKVCALALLTSFAEGRVADEDRELVRVAIRERLHALRDHHDSESVGVRDELVALEGVHEALLPEDPVVRHRWLFAEWYPCFSAGWRRRDRDRYQRELDRQRLAALYEVHDVLGFDGVVRLACACPDQPWVGVTLADLDCPRDELASWVAEVVGGTGVDDAVSAVVRGLFTRWGWESTEPVVRAVLVVAERDRWDGEQLVRFLLLVPACAGLFGIVQEASDSVQNLYWHELRGWCSGLDDGDRAFVVRQLLACGRACAAFQLLGHHLDSVDAALVADVLEGVATSEESDVRLESWSLRAAIERLEASGEIAQEQLVALEFRLLPGLGHLGEQIATSLMEALSSDPDFFASLVCRAFLPEGGDRDSLSEGDLRVAEVAYRALKGCRRVPGTLPDGTVDGGVLADFVDACRSRCADAGRGEVGDLLLGGILAWAPGDADGSWPCIAVRDVLERPGLEDLRQDFSTGVRGTRGVTSRDPWTGGDQERDLEQRYRGYASACRMSHPLVAATLDEVADSYCREGEWEDDRARLRLEGH